MPGIGIITNPFSRTLKQNPAFIYKLEKALGNAGLIKFTKTQAELESTCQEFYTAGIDTVCILGGDGTICLCLNTLAKVYPKDRTPAILLLGGGTINVLLTNLKLPNNPLKNLKKFLKSKTKKKSVSYKRIPTIEVEGKTGFLFANGMATNYLQEFYRKKPGFWGSILFSGKVAIDALASGKINGISSKIIANDLVDVKINTKIAESTSVFSTEMATIIAATYPRIPYGIKLFKHLEWHAGEGEFLALKYCGKYKTYLAIASAAIKTLINMPLNNPNFIQGTFTEIHLDYLSNNTYSLDGDIFTSSSKSISLKMGASFDFCVLS